MRHHLFVILGLWFAAQATAQDYQLVEPTGVISADVFVRHGQMVVNDANGHQYIFHRDRSFDSLDRRYRGYWLPSLNRIVRFPSSGTGLMQVADLDDVFPAYVFSRRSVRRGPGHSGHPRYHHAGRFIPPYFVSPYGYPQYGYGYLSFGTGLSVGGGYPGYGLRPRRYFTRPLQSLTLDSRVVAREPLPPVNVDLLNSAQREIRVTIADRKSPGQTKQLRIAPGTSSRVVFERDAGADLVRTVATYALDGSQITRQITTPVEPAPRYELVVHEWRLQSVAIDRTGQESQSDRRYTIPRSRIGAFSNPTWRPISRRNRGRRPYCTECSKRW